MSGSSKSNFAIKGGAYTDIQELIRLRHGIKEIPAFTVDKSRNPLAGLLTSNFRGRGIDFAEVRQYEPGDDVRTIDWRVTARTQQPHTKLFQEERERPVLFLVDQSARMFFGSRMRFKSVLAAEVAALLAWLSLNGGDRVGGIVFNQEQHRDVRPRRSKHSVLRLLHELDAFNHTLDKTQVIQNDNYLSQALLNARRVARHGCTVVIISDFRYLNDDAESHLRQISQHNDIVGIHIYDPMEAALPKPDLYTITNGDTRLEINTARPGNREAYEAQFETHRDAVRKKFTRLKSPFLSLSTHLEVVPSLASAIDNSKSGRS